MTTPAASALATRVRRAATRIEWWTALGARPASIQERARKHEEAGWDGLFVSDSQCLLPEAFVMLTAAAGATQRVKLAPFATNPVTRHPSLTAAAVAALHEVSGYRAVLGLGRGDSALAHIGRPPVSVAEFEQFVVDVQALLAGKGMAVDVVGGRGRTPALSLVAAPTRTSLQWLDPAAPNVPVVVTATGPRVMRIAGRHTDDVLLAVGAERQRISWGIGTIREAAANAGRDPNELRFGALLTVVPLNDIRAACDLAAASVASVARFSTMYGQRPGGPVSGAARKVYERLASTYDMTQHAQPGSPQTAALTAEFIKEFAVIGSPERCIERLIEIAEEGVTRFVLVPPAVEELVHPRGRAEALGFERARRVLASELLPLARERILG